MVFKCERFYFPLVSLQLGKGAELGDLESKHYRKLYFNWVVKNGKNTNRHLRKGKECQERPGQSQEY